MDKRRNKDAAWRQKIGQSLRGKSKSLRSKAKEMRKSASTQVRKGIIKGSGAAGYVTGRTGAEVAKRPTLRKAVGKTLESVGKVIPEKATTKASNTADKVAKKVPFKPSLRDNITTAKSVDAFGRGAAKGAYDGLKRRKNDKKKKR